MKQVYLDYAATAPMLPSVASKMQEVLAALMGAEFGNPSALHTPGQQSHELLEESRAKVASLIGASPEEILFTSGGSEANNTVMNIFRGQDIAVSAIEHPSVLEPAKKYAANLTLLPVDKDGIVSSSDDTGALTSIMLANNELGTIEPIKELREKVKSAFHTDATQAVGKIPVDVKGLGVDYLTFSAHKLGGPVGIGALYIKKGAKFSPLILGGHQENKRRAGTSNVLLAAGFGMAAEEAKRSLSRYDKIRKLRNRLANEIKKQIPHVHFNTSLEKSLPNLLNVSFAAAEGEAIQLYLDLEGVIVSTGSACASGSLSPSHVIMAVAGDAEIAHGSIRFSLGPGTKESDISRVMDVLPAVIERVRNMSTIRLKEENDR